MIWHLLFGTKVKIPSEIKQPLYALQGGNSLPYGIEGHKNRSIPQLLASKRNRAWHYLGKYTPTSLKGGLISESFSAQISKNRCQINIADFLFSWIVLRIISDLAPFF